jgi:hypothetical protein
MKVVERLDLIETLFAFELQFRISPRFLAASTRRREVSTACAAFLTSTSMS